MSVIPFAQVFEIALKKLVGHIGWFLLLALMGVMFLAGCGGGGGSQQTSVPQLASISVAPSNPTLTLGANQAFTATGKYSDGSTKDLTSAVTWSAANTSVVWLNNTAARKGVGTPRQTGSTTVKATLQGITGSTVATVAALSSRFGYVTNMSDATISRFALDAASSLMSAKEYLYLGPANPKAALIDPGNRFLFFIDDRTGSVWAYTIATTSGELSAVAGSPFKAGSVSRSMAIEPQGKFLYLTDPEGSVYAWAIDGASGALTPVTGSPFSAGFGTTGLAVDPTGRFLYAGNQQDNNVSAFAIGAAGSLTPINGSPFSTGQGPTALAVDPTGQYLYTANVGANSVSAFSIDAAGGALTPVAGSPFSAGVCPVSLVLEPGGQYLYVANQGSVDDGYTGTISAFAVDLDKGSLTSLAAPANGGTFPLAIVADPSGSSLYLVNNGSHDVRTFNIDRQNGAITLAQATRTRTGPASMAFTVGKNPLSITPTFAYAAGAGASDVGAYTVNPASGALTETNGSPFTTDGASISVVAHPSGKFLYVADYWTYKLSSYSIDSNTGALTPAPGSPYASPAANSGPYEVLPEPSGRFLYMTNGYDSLLGMAVDTDTGALASSSWNPVKITSSTPWGPDGFALDPAGRFLFVADSSGGAISGFQINPADGSLTEVPGSPLTLGLQMGNYPEKLSTDPSGKYLYVPVRCAYWAQICPNNALFGFAIDAGDGHLTALQGSPWQTAIEDAMSIALDARGRFLYIVDGGGANVSQAKGTYGFTIDPLTGELTPFAGSPFLPGVITFLNPDPTGNFIYGGDISANSIQVYGIDSTTGALTLNQTLPFKAGGPVWSITVGSAVK
jgi:6-phosphogluconolactonase (cycloisomerase 2 family)